MPAVARIVIPEFNPVDCKLVVRVTVPPPIDMGPVIFMGLFKFMLCVLRELPIVKPVMVLANE